MKAEIKKKITKGKFSAINSSSNLPDFSIISFNLSDGEVILKPTYIDFET